MKKNNKIIIIVNDLKFFLSHRLPIAEALLIKGFEVSIGYGDQGEVDIKVLEQKGFNLKLIPLHRGSINLFKEIKSFIYLWKFIVKSSTGFFKVSGIKLPPNLPPQKPYLSC